MLPLARIAFDPALPVVAAQTIAATAERTLAPGERFDWRELGIDEHTLHIWWMAGLVYFEPQSDTPLPTAPVVVEPQQAKKHRHAERR